MKYLILVFTLLFNCSTAQVLNAVHIHQIGQYKFDDLDDLMVNKHQFKRIKDVEDNNQRVYTNDSEQLDQLLVITVIRDLKGCTNVLSIVDKSAANVFRLKNDLPKEGFEYLGKKKMSEELIVSQFIKGKVSVLISDTVTSTGAYQILLMCR
jgi:hypothetical protein